MFLCCSWIILRFIALGSGGIYTKTEENIRDNKGFALGVPQVLQSAARIRLLRNGS